MMRAAALLCLTLMSVLILSWGLPQLYDMALLKSLDKTHAFFSPVLKKFIYTEQVHGEDEKAAQKSDGHHADIVYKDEDGGYHDRLEFEAALPFIYFRNMEARGLLPVRLEGRILQREDIERSRRVLELPARQLDGKGPAREYLPLLEADPGQVALVYPDDRFRLTATGMQFLNADSNTPDQGLSRRFTDALLAAGFRFPARHVGGNFTTFKPYEGGVFLVDGTGALFHLLRYHDQPRVTAVPLPSGVTPRHVLVSESRERRWLGLMLDDEKTVWLMKELGAGQPPALMPLSKPHYELDIMYSKVIFDPLYLTAVVSDATHLHAAVYRRPQALTDTPLLPLRTFSHHMSRAQRVWQHHLADTIFPFRLTFTHEDRESFSPEITLSPRWASLALPFCLVVALLHGLRLARRHELTGSRWLEVGMILGGGIFSLIPLLLLDERS